MGVAAGLVIFVGLPSLSAAGQPVPTTAPDGAAIPPAPIAGAPAPDFSLLDLEGQSVSLSDQAGNPVLINFWATWCGPCRIEMPFIEAQYQANKDNGFAVLAVDFDEPKADVEAYVRSLGLTFTVLLDPGGVVNDLYRVRGYPSSFFIGRDGVIKVVHIGVMTEAQLADNLSKVLP